MTDTSSQAIPGYDAWKLATPDDDRHEIGHEAGKECRRVHEPDEDAPRWYRPKPCPGTMEDVADEFFVMCSACGEIGDPT